LWLELGEGEMLTLYSYSRSTTSYRVRIALGLKGIVYTIRPVNLVAGEHRKPDYARLNPVKRVPTLVLEDGTVLTKSIAILDYLDQVVPSPRFCQTTTLFCARKCLALAAFDAARPEKQMDAT